MIEKSCKPSLSVDGYLKNAPEISTVHYFDLPGHICVKLNGSFPKNLLRGSAITIQKLKEKFGRNKNLNKQIQSIVEWRNNPHEVGVSFPLHLQNEEYVKLYSLMISEGSYNTEFKLHVPEKEFHALFSETLNKIFGKVRIRQTTVKGILKSTAPRNIRHILPFPNHIPKFILNNEEFAKIYLKIAFEAEAHFRYKILSNGAVSRRIRLTRNVGVDSLIDGKLKYPLGKRIPFSTVKIECPQLSSKVLAHPCLTIFGEYLLLKQLGINSSLYPEYLRINKTATRKGKISVKWALTIHSTNIDTFVKKIGCISKRKKKVAQKMKNVKMKRPNYFAFGIMKNVAHNGVFSLRDYTSEMKKQGYLHPRVFLAKYKKKNLVKKISFQTYELV